MSVQTAYNFDTPFGIAGGIYDLSPYAIDALMNEENDGVMKCGLAVVTGTTAGKQIVLPTSSSDLGDFEGVTVNGRTNEWGLSDEIFIRKTASVGVMRYGRIWVRVVSGEAPAYGDAVYFSVASGHYGEFQKSSSNGVAINARFIGGVNNGLAPIELYRNDLTA